MKFDVIIGNPPYQLEDGGASASATPIYNLFVDAAKKLQPRYLCMVIPARWFSGGKGLDYFRKDMLTDNHLQSICDYFDSTLCFPGVDISGGVCYFLWSRDYKGQCCVRSIMKDGTSEMIRPLLEQGSDVYLRFNQAVDIYRKVQSLSEGNNFDSIVSSRKPFGLTTNIHGESKSKNRTIKCYSNRNVTKEPGYINVNNIFLNHESVCKYKVYISYAYGERGNFPYLILGKPFIGEPGSCCTETYLVIGPFDDKQTAENVMSYIRTRFFRFMVLLKKNTQHATRNVYSFVPMQDFSKPWTDEELYAKYGLNEEEIAFIESMIRPMEA
jgi:site-specific DNA-methyltransferase (adenine-specific)